MSNTANLVACILPDDLYQRFLRKSKANGGEQAYAANIMRSALEGEMIVTEKPEIPLDSSSTEMATQLEYLRAEIADIRREIGSQMTMQNTVTNELISTAKNIRRSQLEMERIFRKLLDQAAE